MGVLVDDEVLRNVVVDVHVGQMEYERSSYGSDCRVCIAHDSCSRKYMIAT
jgi:hypothetical protein